MGPSGPVKSEILEKLKNQKSEIFGNSKNSKL